MPIRIRERSTTEAIARSRGSAQSSAKSLAAPASFGEQLSLAQGDLIRKDLSRLYQDVEEQGRRLLEHPTPHELAKYKAHVRDFVAYVVRNALKLKSSLSSRELHQIIDKVDEELLSLADAFLARERPLMEVAAKIDTINGLLLDLQA